MVQLSDDCFAFGGALMSLAQAEAQLADSIAPLSSAASEHLPLSACLGRILSKDIRAPLPVPPYSNSAVDGYAVGLADVPHDGRCPVVGRAAAGSALTAQVAPGTAVRIFTGAPLPLGCDTVYMQEDVQREADVVILPPGLKRGANTRQAGEDVAQGTLALSAGQRLTPACLGLAASLGLMQLAVRPRPRVTLFSSGDELVAPGQGLRPGQLYDANAPLLAASLSQQGWSVRHGGILPDQPARIAAMLEQAALSSDLVLTSGGVSTGEEDHLRAAVQRQGQLDFWRLGIKPGRPVAMGRLPKDGGAFCPVIGLPGNPVAAYVGFLALVRPLFHCLMARAIPALPRLPARADFSYKKKAGRREFVRVRASQDEGGQVWLSKYHKEGAGMLSGLVWADGLAMLDEACLGVQPGDVVAYTPFGMVD